MAQRKHRIAVPQCGTLAAGSAPARSHPETLLACP